MIKSGRYWFQLRRHDGRPTPNLGREAEMLRAMGYASMDDLFSDVPVDVRMEEDLPLRAPQSEEEIIADARRLLGANVALGSMASFIGAGLYRNHGPAAVFQLVTRGEFLTAYTPYQAEVSQGMLQAMWEFQGLISELVGLPTPTFPSTTAPPQRPRRSPVRFACTAARPPRRAWSTCPNSFRPTVGP